MLSRQRSITLNKSSFFFQNLHLSGKCRICHLVNGTIIWHIVTFYTQWGDRRISWSQNIIRPFFFLINLSIIQLIEKNPINNNRHDTIHALEGEHRRYVL